MQRRKRRVGRGLAPAETEWAERRGLLQNIVIPSQRARWRGNPYPKRRKNGLPHQGVLCKGSFFFGEYFY